MLSVVSVSCQRNAIAPTALTIGMKNATIRKPIKELTVLTTMTLQVYGIPNCGTCKKAFKWLEANSIDYDFINTKEQPPSREQISDWVATLTAKPMRNTSGTSYRALGEEKKTWSDDQWIDAFTADAMLLKRPLFVKAGKAVLVGFRASEVDLQETLAA